MYWVVYDGFGVFGLVICVMMTGLCKIDREEILGKSVFMMLFGGSDAHLYIFFKILGTICYCVFFHLSLV